MDASAPASARPRAAGRQSLRLLKHNVNTVCQTETLFHTYSQFAAAPNIPQKPSEDELKTETNLQELLEKREALVGQLTRLLDSEASSSAVKLNNLARHRLKKLLLWLLDLRPSECSLLSLVFRSSKYFKWT